jgi:hypothetical protein
VQTLQLGLILTLSLQFFVLNSRAEEPLCKKLTFTQSDILWDKVKKEYETTLSEATEKIGTAKDQVTRLQELKHLEKTMTNFLTAEQKNCKDVYFSRLAAEYNPPLYAAFNLLANKSRTQDCENFRERPDWYFSSYLHNYETEPQLSSLNQTKKILNSICPR